MLDIGRVCIKIAGRDAGQKCVIVDVLDGNYVMIEGATRRRKCNMSHLEPTTQTVDVPKNASHEVVAKALNITAKTISTKQKVTKPKTTRSTTVKAPVPEKKQKKTAAKKAE